MQFSHPFLVSRWACSTPRNRTATELTTNATLGLTGSAHARGFMQIHTWLSTGTSPSSQGPILPRLPWFWQLHAAKHHSRECTCIHVSEDPACPTHRDLYSLTHRRHQHCQSTYFRPDTEPCNTPAMYHHRPRIQPSPSMHRPTFTTHTRRHSTQHSSQLNKQSI